MVENLRLIYAIVISLNEVIWRNVSKLKDTVNLLVKYFPEVKCFVCYCLYLLRKIG